MPEEQKESPPTPGHQERSKGLLLDWLDVIAKLVGAASVLAVAFIANSFQSRVTDISIQSQREQAESQLRANMFSSLIGPIIGAQKDGKAISPDREELLAELLALNFHENFELKPLLEDASERLVPKANRKDLSRDPDPREPLWSIARRIAERQKASIAWEWTADKSSVQNQGRVARLLRREAPARRGCEFYTLTVNAQLPPSSEMLNPVACELAMTLGQVVRLKSPDGIYTLQLTVVHPDWKNQTVSISVLPFLSRQQRPLEADTTYRFPLSWFDFPLTDNTLLADGNRFAIYLRLVSSDNGKMTVLVMWFPKGYFTPRERPLNYQEVQHLLGRPPG
jgi:hypothetical protein